MTLTCVVACGGEALAAPAARHEITLALAGVYDGGYDRGIHLGLAYELSVSVLRVSVLGAFGDTDPRRELHYALRVGVQPVSWLRLDVALHHFSFPGVGFGENTFTLVGALRWRGLRFDAGVALRFPITRRDDLQNPVVFYPELFEYFLLYRAGYLWTLPRGFTLGGQVANISRFDVRNFNYPAFTIVVGWAHPRVGAFVLEAGVGIAGFASLGATLDQGILSLEFTRAIP